MDYSVYEENKMSFSAYLTKCFMWMFLGLLVTFGVSALFSYSGLFLKILTAMGTPFILISSIIEIILVISLSRSIMKITKLLIFPHLFVYCRIETKGALMLIKTKQKSIY